MNKDKEGWTSDKINWWFSTAIKGGLSDKIPYRLDKFSDFDIQESQEKFQNRIDAILIDIDDCVAPAYGEIIEENIQKVEYLLSIGIKLGILSNGINIEERCKNLTERGVVICKSQYSKPAIQSYVLACEQLGVVPENTLMIGDDISKDGGALRLDSHGNSAILGYVPVEPIGNNYKNIPGLGKKINYLGKKLSRGIANYRNK